MTFQQQSNDEFAFSHKVFLRFLVFLLGGLSFFDFAHAQTRDRLSLSYDSMATASGISAEFFELNANHRFFLDQDGASLLTIGLQYRQLDLDTLEVTPQDRHRELKMLVPQISLAQILNDNYSLIVTLRPGFFGNLETDFGRTFRFEGGAVVTRVMNEKLTLGLGAARGSNFGRDLIVPLLQALYLPTPTLMVDVLLPVKAEVWYLPSKFIEYGAVFNIVGSLYTVDRPSFNAEELGFANMNLGLAARRHLVSTLYFHVEGGVTVSRRHEWSTDREPIRSREIDKVAYYRAALHWRF